MKIIYSKSSKERYEEINLMNQQFKEEQRSNKEWNKKYSKYFIVKVVSLIAIGIIIATIGYLFLADYMGNHLKKPSSDFSYLKNMPLPWILIIGLLAVLLYLVNMTFYIILTDGFLISATLILVLLPLINKLFNINPFFTRKPVLSVERIITKVTNDVEYDKELNNIKQNERIIDLNNKYNSWLEFQGNEYILNFQKYENIIEKIPLYLKESESNADKLTINLDTMEILFPMKNKEPVTE